MFTQKLPHTIKHSLMLCLFMISFTLPLASIAADIKVSIDRAKIQLNETFTLVFEANDDVDENPDFSPLEKDFQILNQSTSSNISLINGKYTKSLRWNVSLIALREGNITIPSIKFGADKSPSYQITISPIQKSNGKSGEEFISELEVSTNSAYPQSQIIVTQRMLSSRNINGYEFSSLKFTGVEVSQEALGELKQYQTKRGETPYLVLEQSFAIYPQASGTLNIEPSIASARIALNNRSQFNSFRSNSKTVRRVSENKTINVKPVPSSFKGKHWLPAKEVQLVDEFPEAQTFNAGEPITRTLSLLVDGQSASQLPEFSIQEINNLKQYPDKPALNDNTDDNGITGIQQIKVAIIPSQEGSYTLPAISIPWWNTSTDKMEIASIPARTFTVGQAGGISTPDPATTTTKPDINTTVTPVESNTPLTPCIQAQTTTPDTGSLTWKVISLLLFIAWLITLFLLFRNKQAERHKRINPENHSESLNKLIKKIKQACDAADALQCKDALLLWGRSVFSHGNIYSLGELSKHVPETLAEKINSLNAHLYKNDSQPWACDQLAELCESFSSEHAKDTHNKKNQDQLEALYP